MKKIILLACSLLMTAGFMFAQNNEKKFSGWKKAETEHFVFIYEDAQKEATEGYVKIADDAWNKIGKIYAFPQDKTNVFVTGRTNTVNAFTYSTPLELVMFTNPCTLIQFPFRDNWQKLFFTHELIHIANFGFEDRSKLPQKLFGSFMTSIDFNYVNGWALEGLTTVLETELTNGGRGRSPYFEMDFKAVTLDNGFISYEDIGLEKEPPASQIYVMGYLIMRSIADRYGIQALADIERNRSFMGSWEQSVLLVTGETPQDIYRDVRIALAKKYADERKIPEGITISPRDLKTNYFKPAIVNDDGTIIALRTAKGADTAVVRLDPSAKRGRNYIEDSKPEKDLNTVFKETVLFSGNFMDSESVTADENGRIYAALGIQIGDKAPGVSLESAIHVWTKDGGVRRLTRDVSLFMPSVSRDGKTLVAVEQHGMDMRLVKVDTETGKTSVLLEKPGLSFIQPAVNDDGSKVAFLVLDDTRARVGVLNTATPSDFKIVANDDEQIYDPLYPSWNSDGNLTFACNYRGRVEVFEIKEGGAPVPVVADPVGALWTYKNQLGIYYLSKSSSGSVIKMKPDSEWGKVPATEGPSPAGEILTFGSLENDYPDFKPYTVLSEIEDTSDEKEKEKGKTGLFKKNTDSEEPVPVRGKKVKHRSQENIDKANQENPTVTEITNEKNYFCITRPILYFPYVDFLEDKKNNKTYFGIGESVGLLAPRLQLSNGIGFGYLSYFPELNNFTGNISLFSSPVAQTALDVTLRRKLGEQSNLFVETNTLQLGYTYPLISRLQGKNEIFLLGYGYVAGSLYRCAAKMQSITGDYVNAFGATGGAGLEFGISKTLPRNCSQAFDLVLMGIGFCNSFNEKTNLLFGAETEISYVLDQKVFNYELSVKGRYSPFPDYICPENSAVKYGGRELDCSMPIRVVPRVALGVPKSFLGVLDTKLYCEMLLSGDTENKNSFQFDQSLMTGIEVGYFTSQLDVAAGSSFRIDYDEDVSLDDLHFYIRMKLSWFRF